MFFRSGPSSGEPPEEAPVEDLGPIFIEPDASRPATVLRVAGELEERGGEIVELFKEVRAPGGASAVVPIYLAEDGTDLFVEIETRPWSAPVLEEVLGKAVVLRNSERYAEADFEILSAYPVPEELEFLCGKSPAALFQLDLLRVNPEGPKDSARVFCEAARRRWDVELGYDAEELPLVEQLLLAALDGESRPVLDVLVSGLGCFLGETIRRSAGALSSWEERQEWSEGPIVEFANLVIDPVGKARAFLENGSRDSISFYAAFALKEIESHPPESAEPPAR